MYHTDMHKKRRMHQSVLASLQRKDRSRQRIKGENVPDDPELTGTALLATCRVFYLQVIKKEKEK